MAIGKGLLMVQIGNGNLNLETGPSCLKHAIDSVFAESLRWEHD